jgi:tetratricopeptide (TPR) repeat protein
VNIARVYLVLDEPQKAKRFNKHVVEAERGKLALTRIEQSEEDAFQKQKKRLDDLLGAGNRDVTRNSLKAYIVLYEQTYGTEKRRKQTEKQIRSAFDRVPAFRQINTLMGLTRAAIARGDCDNATRLINEAHAVMENYRWRPQHRMPMLGQLAELRYLAGSKQKARKEAKALFERYKANQQAILITERAKAILPLGEAYATMGRVEKALMVYGQALEAGTDSPNGRVRANALWAVCRSMALHEAEPDNELWAKLRETYESLNAPW